MSYILDQTPLNIFLDIIQIDSGFLETLNRSSNSTEMILLTLQVMLKMIETPFAEHIRTFLNEVRNKVNYWKQIENMLKETTVKQQPAKETKQKKKNNKVILHRNETELWQHILSLSEAFIKHVDLPNGFVKNLLAIIDGNKNENLNLNQFQPNFQQLLKKFQPNGVNSADSTYETYYEMNIHPTLDELKQKQIDYVAPNIIEGRFDSIEHYLNIQLALLREDFIGPLRTGIGELIEKSKADPDAKPKSNLNVRVMSDVHIVIKGRDEKSNFKNDHIMVDLLASERSDQVIDDPKNYSEPHINSNKFAKRLMYGSLLCFTTSTAFDDLIIAIVSNRDTELIGMGYVCFIWQCKNDLISMNSHLFIFFFRFKLKSSKRLTSSMYSKRISL